LIDLGRGLSGLDYQKIMLRGSISEAAWLRCSKTIDLLLIPAQGIASPTTAQMARLGEDAEMLNALIRFTCPFDMTGSPTITLPCGFTDAGTRSRFSS
jgi:amidase